MQKSDQVRVGLREEALTNERRRCGLLGLCSDNAFIPLKHKNSDKSRRVCFFIFRCEFWVCNEVSSTIQGVVLYDKKRA